MLTLCTAGIPLAGMSWREAKERQKLVVRGAVRWTNTSHRPFNPCDVVTPGGLLSEASSLATVWKETEPLLDQTPRQFDTFWGMVL